MGLSVAALDPARDLRPRYWTGKLGFRNIRSEKLKTCPMRTIALTWSLPNVGSSTGPLPPPNWLVFCVRAGAQLSRI